MSKFPSMWPENGRKHSKCPDKLENCSQGSNWPQCNVDCNYFSHRLVFGQKKKKIFFRKICEKSEILTPRFWQKMSMTIPSSESRSVGNHDMIVMLQCQWSPSDRRMQRTSNQHRTTHTEKMGGHIRDLRAFFAIFRTFSVEISRKVAGKWPEPLKMPR